jgi:flavodoxin I
MFTRTTVGCALVGYAAAFSGMSPLALKPTSASTSALRLRAAGPSMKIGVFFGTSTGNTESVATRLATALGGEAIDISSCEAAKLMEYDTILAGAPTWNTDADKERSSTAWDEIIYDDLTSLDLSGKKVAFFGCGDSSSYGDYWCDSMGELHECFGSTGATVIGMVPAANFEGEYDDSKAISGDKFVGHPFCEDSMPEKTDERIAAWVTQLVSEGAK